MGQGPEEVMVVVMWAGKRLYLNGPGRGERILYSQGYTEVIVTFRQHVGPSSAQRHNGLNQGPAGDRWVGKASN